MDFSEISELTFLAELVAEVRRNAPSVPFYLAGATARDLLLHYGHGIDVGRQTRDVDLALAVENWEQFQALRTGLMTGGRFHADGNVLHKLKFDGWLEVDVVPFGAIERPDRTIAWPPDGAFVMNVFGFREVYDATRVVRLPGGEALRIVSLPALAILKLKAWEGRRLTSPGKDAHDLALLLRTYLDAGNHERVYEDAAHLLDAPDFDLDEAGAWLLGRDMALTLPAPARQEIATLLENESNPDGQTRLVGDIAAEKNMSATQVLRLLQSLTRGFTENSIQ